MVPDDIEILLIEDNPKDAELTMITLIKENLANRVYLVKDRAEAFDYIYANGEYVDRDLENKPNVILLNWNLPKVDGLEILKKLKEDNSTKMIPIVVMTSSKEEEDIVNSYNFGVNRYITKPIDFEKFITSVSELGLYWLLLHKRPF